MAMGGFLSPETEWNRFDQRWTGTLLYSHNLTHSHIVELVHRKKEFQGWTDIRHNEFLLGARELMNAHLNAGFVAVLRRDDYQNHYKALPKGGSRLRTPCMACCSERACRSHWLSSLTS
jgi:hypothetical protein